MCTQIMRCLPFVFLNDKLTAVFFFKNVVVWALPVSPTNVFYPPSRFHVHSPKKLNMGPALA